MDPKHQNGSSGAKRDRTRITIGVLPSMLVETYGWSGLVESTHGYLEAGSLSNEDILLGYPHIFKGDAPSV